MLCKTISSGHFNGELPRLVCKLAKVKRGSVQRVSFEMAIIVANANLSRLIKIIVVVFVVFLMRHRTTKHSQKMIVL